MTHYISKDNDDDNDSNYDNNNRNNKIGLPAIRTYDIVGVAMSALPKKSDARALPVYFKSFNTPDMLTLQSKMAPILSRHRSKCYNIPDLFAKTNKTPRLVWSVVGDKRFIRYITYHMIRLSSSAAAVLRHGYPPCRVLVLEVDSSRDETWPMTQNNIIVNHHQIK